MLKSAIIFLFLALWAHFPALAVSDTATSEPGLTDSATSEPVVPVPIGQPAFSPVRAEVELPLWDKMQKETLAPIARAGAWLLALQKASDELKTHTMVNIGLDGQEQRMALAMALQIPSFTETVIPGTPDKIRVEVSLAPPAEDIEKALPKAVNDLNMRLWYRVLLDFSAPKATEALKLVEIAFNSRSLDTFYERISFLSEQMASFWILNEAWRLDPREAVPKLKKALEQDQNNPVLLASYGEKLLVTGHTLDALKALDSALALAPDLAPALYFRGLTHMRLHQLALAEADLGQALRQEKENSDWLRARGAVRMLREDYAPMCEDFMAACSLGDCEGLAMVRKKGLCLNKP